MEVYPGIDFPLWVREVEKLCDTAETFLCIQWPHGARLISSLSQLRDRGKRIDVRLANKGPVGIDDADVKFFLPDDDVPSCWKETTESGQLLLTLVFAIGEENEDGDRSTMKILVSQDIGYLRRKGYEAPAESD